MSAIAVEVAQGEIARGRLQKRGTKRAKHPEHKKHKDKHDSSKKYRKSPSPGNDKGSSSKAKSDTWDKPRLNKECNGIHRLRDCPNTSDEKKKELFEEYRAQRKNNNGGNKFMKAVKLPDGTPPDASEGRYRILLEDQVTAVALGDYGSDESAISSAVCDKLLASNQTGFPTILADPIKLSTAISSTTSNPITFTASRRVTLSVTIILPNTHLPIRIHGVPFLVVDQEMDEALLGRPFLK